MATIVLDFKNIENDDETAYDTFNYSQKLKQLLMKVILMIYLNESILQLYQTYKSLCWISLCWKMFMLDY